MFLQNFINTSSAVHEKTIQSVATMQTVNTEQTENKHRKRNEVKNWWRQKWISQSRDIFLHSGEKENS